MFRTHSSGPVATNDCLKRGKRKNQRDPGLTVSYLGSIPAPLPVCSLPKPSSSCEPVPAPAASNIGSKIFPGGQGPSCFYPDLPFQLFLNSASGLHRNLHLRSPSPRLQAQPSLCPGVLPRLPLLSESHCTFTAPLSWKYSWTPTAPDRITASLVRVLKSVLCPPLIFHGRLLTPKSCSAFASLWRSGILAFTSPAPLPLAGPDRQGWGARLVFVELD